MLTHLYIQNFALIDRLDIDLHPGFSVITGETGAGKSIILGALGLLLGRRADSRQVKAGERRCTIEATFTTDTLPESLFADNALDYDPAETILRREVTAAGKSRAFVNDTPVPLPTLRAIASRLVDIHSQHQNLLIERADFQLSVLDTVAANQPQGSNGRQPQANADGGAPTLPARYRAAYDRWHEAEGRLRQLKSSLDSSRREEDFMRYQLKELEAARLADGEQQQLEQEANTLEHAEDIKTALYEADTLLSADERGATDSVRRAQQSLQHIAAVYAKADEAAQRLDTLLIDLADIAADISAEAEAVDFDPQRLDTVNSRLDQLNTLQQKYHAADTAQLLALQDDLRRRLDGIDHSDEAIARLQTEADQLRHEAGRRAAALTKARQKAAKTVEKEMLARLVPLGLPHVRFEVSIQPLHAHEATTKQDGGTDKPTTTQTGGTTASSAPALGPNGADAVQFLFSANTSTPLQPVADVASGGEVARVMLSLKALLSGAAGLPTIIFDEIDTGVSGRVAQSMADIMRQMAARGQQVISITHLPQLAAAGQHHYRVEKTETPNGTESHMRQLNTDERTDEVAQMLSGSDITEAARENARTLLSSPNGGLTPRPPLPSGLTPRPPLQGEGE